MSNLFDDHPYHPNNIRKGKIKLIILITCIIGLVIAVSFLSL